MDTATLLKVALKQIGFEARRVRHHPGDARGSEPFVAYGKKTKIFIKVVSRKHNLADWAFKLSRRILYRRLEDEVPYNSPKQALEHEAYIETLAHEAGVRCAEIKGLVDLGDTRFGLVKTLIDGRPLSKVSKARLTGPVVAAIWREAEKLHQAAIAHRDLRAANIILDKHGRVWLTDFDFATVAATENNIARDRVELLVSLATLVGAQQAVKYAAAALKPKDFVKMRPFLKYRHLSHATRQEVKQNPRLLDELVSYIEVVSAVSA